jgi:hypothetical protein
VRIGFRVGEAVALEGSCLKRVSAASPALLVRRRTAEATAGARLSDRAPAAGRTPVGRRRSETAERARSPPLPARLFLRVPRALPESIPLPGWHAANGGKVGRRPTQLVFGWVVGAAAPELHPIPAATASPTRKSIRAEPPSPHPQRSDRARGRDECLGSLAASVEPRRWVFARRAQRRKNAA